MASVTIIDVDANFESEEKRENFESFVRRKGFVSSYAAWQHAPKLGFCAGVHIGVMVDTEHASVVTVDIPNCLGFCRGTLRKLRVDCR